jgi:hypothetical protein
MKAGTEIMYFSVKFLQRDSLCLTLRTHRFFVCLFSSRLSSLWYKVPKLAGLTQTQGVKCRAYTVRTVTYTLLHSERVTILLGSQISYFSDKKKLWDPDDDTFHLKLFSFWTLSIVWCSK